VTSWDYIVRSVPWSLAGLLIGVFIGRLTVAADAIAAAVQDEETTMPDPRTPRRRRWRITKNGVVVGVLVTLGLLTGVQAYVQGEATDRLAECQATYSNALADALDARFGASSEAQQALDELLSTVSAAAPTPEGGQQVRQALADYQSKRADAKRAQKDNPYPPAPRDACKEAH
jgi:hypothetical protein